MGEFRYVALSLNMRSMCMKTHGVGLEAASYDTRENKKEWLGPTIPRYVEYPMLSASRHKNTRGVIINQNGAMYNSLATR